jgi:hypothetical protein
VSAGEESAAMLHWLTRRETIVALAMAGGVFSIASWALAGRSPGGASLARWCNGAAYAFMGASMLLFILAGLA